MITYNSNTKYKVLTPQGFKDFKGIRRTTKEELLTLFFENGTKLECSRKHLFNLEGINTPAETLKPGQTLSSTKVISKIHNTGTSKFLYDLVEVGEDSLYIADGIISHNCDFSTSGDTVIYGDLIEFYENTYKKDPEERRGVDRNLWIWEPVDYSRNYMVVADVARGDGKDFSTFHIIDIENCSQVGEYKGQLPPKEFAHLLVGISTEYNNALLVVENANIGWSTIETIQERGYTNLYHSPKSGNVTADSYFDPHGINSNMTPGFTTSSKTRPLVIAKLQESINDKSAIIRSKRMLGELKVFVWRNNRAEAQSGYNDDLVIPWGIAMYVRETAFRIQRGNSELARSVWDNVTATSAPDILYLPSNHPSTGQMDNGIGGQEDISWIYK
jgi:hypothetical protein